MHDLMELHDGPIPLNKISTTSDVIDFARFQEVYAVIAEIEGTRCCTYRETIQNENDFTGSVLGHMRDFTLSDEEIASLTPPAPDSPTTQSGANLTTAGSNHTPRASTTAKRLSSVLTRPLSFFDASTLISPERNKEMFGGLSGQ